MVSHEIEEFSLSLTTIHHADKEPSLCPATITLKTTKSSPQNPSGTKGAESPREPVQLDTQLIQKQLTFLRRYTIPSPSKEWAITDILSLLLLSAPTAAALVTGPA